MKKPFYAALALLALPMAISNAYAADDSKFAVSGYGTIGYAVTDTDQASFSRANQYQGVGKTPRNSVDSNLGVQTTYTANDWLSATAQVLVRQNATDEYSADLNLGFVKAKVTEELSIRVGRTALPTFMISDYRNIGYANTLIRPPIEMYSQVPFDTIDGVDAIYQRAFGDTTLTAQLALGRAKAKLNANGPIPGSRANVEASKIGALNIVAEHGPLTARFGYAQATMTIDDAATVNGLLTGLRTAGAGYHFDALGKLADELDMKDKKGTFTSIGLTYNQNNILLQTELAKRTSDSYVADTFSWYTMAGYKLGKVTPYVSYASLRRQDVVENTVPTACPAGYPAACGPTMAALRAGVTTLTTTATNGEQSTISAGARWDVTKSAALKAQLDHIKPRNGQGLLLDPAANFKGSVNVLSVAVDYVF